MPEPKTLKIDNVEYIRRTDAEAMIKKQVKLKPALQAHPFTVGQFFHLETVTKFFVGTVVAVTDSEIILDGAAWVAHMGRPHAYFKGTAPTSLEPLGDGYGVCRGSLVSFKAMERIEIVVR